MAIFYKEDVTRAFLDPMQDVIKTLGKMYERYSEDLFITSGTEGTHSINSLHYIGHAVDFRPGSRSKGDVVTCLRNAGYNEIDFDLVDGYASGHYHLEYDPKTGQMKKRQDQLYDAYMHRLLHPERYKELRLEWIELYVK
jgi:hypothetical protein